jgi:hypothetical protein
MHRSSASNELLQEVFLVVIQCTEKPPSIGRSIPTTKLVPGLHSHRTVAEEKAVHVRDTGSRVCSVPEHADIHPFAPKLKVRL